MSVDKRDPEVVAEAARQRAVEKEAGKAEKAKPADTGKTPSPKPGTSSK